MHIRNPFPSSLLAHDIRRRLLGGLQIGVHLRLEHQLLFIAEQEGDIAPLVDEWIAPRQHDLFHHQVIEGPGQWVRFHRQLSFDLLLGIPLPGRLTRLTQQMRGEQVPRIDQVEHGPD